ncbi:hypothetical protein J3R82DRAFT_1538 [Butyriboletus roseoflavus]|nr:hypothetical protein J3R82DRAFT_1538 [Butyriboletus roseoflavus]
MISFPVQLFIAWRVKVMSKSSILPAIITFFAFASLVGGIATAVAVILIHLEYSLFPQNDGAVITWLASSAAADIIITVSLVYSLLRKRTGFVATDDIINRIIRLTIQTGLITAMAAMLDVTLFLVLKVSEPFYRDVVPDFFFPAFRNYIWDLTLSKLYSNSILSTLNARGTWKATSVIRDNVLFGNGSSVESMPRSRPQITMAVTTEIQTRRDSNTLPMKIFETGAGYVHEDSDSAVNDVQDYGEAV